MGRRIRQDYDGVITATGQFGAVPLRGGDEIPDGVAVDGYFTDDGQPVRPPVATSPAPGTGPAGPLVDEEVMLALAHGVDVARGPDYVRGFLDAVAELGAASAGGAGPHGFPAGYDVVAELTSAFEQALSTGEATLRLPDGDVLRWAPEEPAGQSQQPAGQPTHLEVPAFDPAEHTVAEVTDYLDAHPEDVARVLDVERAGKGRRGVLNHHEREG